MSLQAISWALDASQAAGNDRLVMIVMCHYTHDDGFSGLSKATLTEETRLSEATVIRCQNELVKLGETERASVEDAPDWWLAYPVNRRPALFKMVGFLGSHYATPVRKRAARKSGVSLGSHRGVIGVADTPPDQGLRDVISEQRTENNSASPKIEAPKPDPNCVRCHGDGEFYNGAGGFTMRCPCTEQRALSVVRS